MRKQSFCTMCCEHHIGIKYPKKRVECKIKCKQVIKIKKRKKFSGKRNKLRNVRLPKK